MTRIKICGITRWDDAERAAGLGVDALGFVFWPSSPRAIAPAAAADIIRRLPPFVVPVGVFVDAPPDRIFATIEACRLGAVQLHGNEEPELCGRIPVKVIKAFRIRESTLPEEIGRYAVDAILLDTFRPGVAGGTGCTFPWEVARRARAYGRVILAGGLTPENVGQAIEAVSPYAVDVSSGVEIEPGRKDPALMAAFVREVRDARRPSGRGSP
ncbi:MAG: phosphoribosylanthranilate isomerase [bacterium]